MLHAITLDQLRTFIAAADEGSFSGAGRKLRRAQSVVSQTLANLAGQFGVKLFDRARRRASSHKGRGDWLILAPSMPFCGRGSGGAECQRSWFNLICRGAHS